MKIKLWAIFCSIGILLLSLGNLLDGKYIKPYTPYILVLGTASAILGIMCMNTSDKKRHP